MSVPLSVIGSWHTLAVVVLMMVGLYTLIAKPNYVKKLMGLSIFQTAIILLYVSIGRVVGGTAPIYLLRDGAPRPEVVYSNPVPHVLMLTAIVVGVATIAVGLALVVRIRGAYGSTEEDIVVELDRHETETGSLHDASELLERLMASRAEAKAEVKSE